VTNDHPTPSPAAWRRQSGRLQQYYRETNGKGNVNRQARQAAGTKRWDIIDETRSRLSYESCNKQDGGQAKSGSDRADRRMDSQKAKQPLV